jgi:hypothetical protein
MKPLKRPKIGLVGMMCTPFQGNKENNYSRHRESLEELASRFDFEFHPIIKGIYNASQAAAAAKEMDEWGADFIILQSASFASGDFVYPFAELESRLGIWTVPEGAPSPNGGLPLNSFTGGNLYNSIIRSYLTGYRRPVKWFLGDPGQALFDTRLQVTVQALRALINLPGTRIGLLGGVAPSFDNLIIDERKLKEQLDISVVKIELDEVLQRARRADSNRSQAAAAEIRASAAHFDTTLETALNKSGRTAVALSELADEHNLKALAVSCWPRFQTEEHLAVCTVMGHLNTNGMIAACEGDVTSAVSMYALHCMTNGDVVTLMDLVTVDQADESILLWHCGPTSPAMADERGTKIESLYLFDGPEGEQTGLHNDLVLKPGRGTVLGFTVNFDRMLVLDGIIDNTKPSYNGSRGWLRQLRLNGEPVFTPSLVQTIMVSGYQHHYPFVYGEVADVGMELCGWLGITPIAVEKYTNYVR